MTTSEATSKKRKVRSTDGTRKKTKVEHEDMTTKSERKAEKNALKAKFKITSDAANGVSKEEKKATKAAKKAERDAKKAAKKNFEEELNNGGPRMKEIYEERAQLKAARKASEAAQEAKEMSDPQERKTSTTVVSSTRISSSYIQQSSLASVSNLEIDEFFKKHIIQVAAKSELTPILSFEHLSVAPLLSAGLSNYKKPTPIQSASWPYLLSGTDLVGIAETGSGKTMAFGLPAINHILLNELEGVSVLVLSPTRELAMQTHEALTQLGEKVGVRSVCLYGGVAKDAQRRNLLKANIIVGTPGRINDLIEEGAADMSKISFLILDEADRMLDTGFEVEIKRIIRNCPSREKRQTVMTSATWPESIRRLADEFMVDPVKITIGSDDLAASQNVTQIVEVIEDPRDKEHRLYQLLKEHQSGTRKDDRIIVFALYKKEASRVEMNLQRKGFNAKAIHGDLSQAQRTQTLEDFKSGKTPLLIATDVAARGLDIPKVEIVINLTFPLTIEDYVHRIGRTGRAGAKGRAITLFTSQDKGHSGNLVNVLKRAGQHVPLFYVGYDLPIQVPEELTKFGTHVKKKEHSAYGAHFKDIDDTVKATKIKF
ncbi:ATP-dependent RNA helicase dbp3 [Neolecta irregularis DAH-3]|uniref:RNA helicase n=1 Tax=Neolecta irregularis (strain DAH-3) TaxID=1198029 RepID=A0A1U7LNN0_NEOID|nr:ATP-dependent RNA helicase dbp3 [Neolecta irregularis DAH-3]|eukprot:OLL24131.1 ATP-dependent RNA helicase dbp3 [Neolecta irregularis DAH-3]